MLLLALTFLTAEPTQTSSKARVLVLELRNDSASSDAARFVRDELTTSLARAATGVEVTSIEELRRAMALEGEKQQAGCADESCVAEIAQAMGAEYVVFGDVAVLGALTVAHVTLQDVRAARAIARETIEVADVEALTNAARVAAKRLAAALPGGNDARISPLLVGGGVAVGAGIIGVVVGGAIAAVQSSIVSDNTLIADGGPSGDEKFSAQQTGQIGFAAAVAGASIAVGGAALVVVGLNE
jgi:hypothetical protein